MKDGQFALKLFKDAILVAILVNELEHHVPTCIILSAGKAAL